MSFDLDHQHASIKGDLWLVCDGNRPIKPGAGRGPKQLVSIENGRIDVYSSASSQSRLIMTIQMRNVRRQNWFVHNPKSAEAESTASAPPKRGRSFTLTSNAQQTRVKPYFYFVVEVLRDNTAPLQYSKDGNVAAYLMSTVVAEFELWKEQH